MLVKLYEGIKKFQGNMRRGSKDILIILKLELSLTLLRWID